MKKPIISLTLATILFAGCGAKTADTMGGNVYTPNQLNQVQKLQNITIVDINSAKVAVNNDGDQTVSTGVGAVLGGLAGAVAGYAIGGGSSSKGAMIGATAGAKIAMAAMRARMTTAILDPAGSLLQPWRRSPGRESPSSVRRWGIRRS